MARILFPGACNHTVVSSHYGKHSLYFNLFKNVLSNSEITKYRLILALHAHI